MPTRQDASGYWHAEACVRRRRLHRRLPAGSTARDAKRVEAELVRALHASAPGAAPRQPQIPGDPPLPALLADYTERHTLTLRSPATARYHALRIGRWCEGRRASEAREVARAIVDDLHGHYAAATINRSLAALKFALRAAWERGEAAADYSAAVRLLPVHNARTTSLTMAQVQRLADHAGSDALRAVIWLALFTGCRRGEIVKLRREDVGPHEITIQAGNTKTLRTRTVPIVAPARPWLKHVPIALSIEGVKTGFRRAREAAGMPHVTLHDLRRSCGTLMARAGVPLHVISRILGHSSTAVTEKVYAHLAPQQLKAGLDTLAALHRGLHRRRAPAGKKRVSR